ncbi:MAG: LacI family DNA-binding transcriptional regulator [Ancrocorticia sp.]|uniref:LacI family DNA-binding transcriptional regulator n=1 Tax=Ancrocorticia sp. TaxID=2593684 RepID=UPI003F9157AC
MGLKSVTLAQVAEASGVSLKTASRVLAGEPNVAPKTRERVLGVARSLGYRRNAAASLLASGQQAEVITVITGDITNPFYASIAQGLEERTRERRMILNLSSSNENVETEWELATSAARLRSRALIVVSAMEDHSRYLDLLRTGMTVVFVDREARGIEADSVVLDDEAGGKMAAAHLLGFGHERIAYIGDYEWLPTQQWRLAGYTQAMEQAGAHGWQELVRTGAHDVESARKVAGALVEREDSPTAFIGGNNRSALAILQELRLRYPAAVRPALIGFDDVEWASVLGMSVISSDPVEVGRQAADLAIARIEDPSRDAQIVRLPMTLTARGSGERAPFS